MTIHGTAELMMWIPCDGRQMEHLRGLPEWQELAETITLQAKAQCRQILSHHTTSHCQVRGAAEAAPLTSLKDHGLSDPQRWRGDSPVDRWWIHAVLPATFAKDDNLPMDYWGPLSRRSPVWEAGH